jgi:glutamyl-tRNA synthetase
VREDGSPTYHLASVVDDVDFGITHVVRGNDHRPNEAAPAAVRGARRDRRPKFVHHGLILGEDGKKLSKRAEGATVAQLREAGIPAEAVRATSRSWPSRSTTCTTTCRGSGGSRPTRSARSPTRS